MIRKTRREFLTSGSAACLTLAVAPAFADPAPTPAKIEAVELIELHGRYTDAAGVNGQQQVNPLDVYDSLRPAPYADHPSGTKEVQYSAVYLKIRTGSGIEGLYGPIEKAAALIVQTELRPFLLGKDALAGEALWDQMYRSNRHSRDGLFMMAISAVDNTLWDIRGRYYNVPVYRLLGGPTRSAVEMYASCLGFSLEPAAVGTRALALQKEGYRYQKWFMGYGPGSGPEGMRKNVELVRILRETLGDDTELMFDAYSGWDQNYALEWAHQVERYRPRWIEEATHPEKIDSFVAIRRSTTHSRSPRVSISTAAGKLNATSSRAPCRSSRRIRNGAAVRPSCCASARSRACTTCRSFPTDTACAPPFTSSPVSRP